MAGDATGLSERQGWLLLIVDSVPHLDGATRLQKYALLASKIVLDGESAYDDWEPHHFGAYSRQVSSDMAALEERGLVGVRRRESGYGPHATYSISASGREAAGKFKVGRRGPAERIKAIATHYFGRALDELLADAYALFPEYTGKSAIRGRVRTSILRRDARLGAGIALPYTDRRIGLSSITDTAGINRFPYNDEEFRRELAKQAGLADVPPTDPKAYDELSEVFAGKEFLANLTDEDVGEIMGSIR